MDPNKVEILLVEDNPQDADMTMRTLRKNNFLNPLLWVKNGQEALDFLFCEGAYAGRQALEPLKLILLDIQMPKVDGIEVLQRLKADERFRKVPIVIMTSSNEQREVTKAYELGVNSFIVKPVEFGAFVETVAKIGMYWLMTNRALDV